MRAKKQHKMQIHFTVFADVCLFSEITQVLIVPLMWPTGTFSLYQPVSGCPHSNKWFETGWRFYDTEDEISNNSWSRGDHLPGKLKKRISIR